MYGYSWFPLPLTVLIRNKADADVLCTQGFMSLAQANYASPNRTRYGQDYYDERMSAGIGVYVEFLLMER